MTTQATLLRTLDAYRARTGTSARRIGAAALGDPGFVSTLAKGRSIRLSTADRLLAFLGETSLGPAFRCEVEAFLRITRTKRSVFGQAAAGDPSFVTRLRRGVSPTLRTVDRVRTWMHESASAGERAGIAAAVAEALAGGPPCPVSACASPDPSTVGATTMQHDQKTYLSTREAAAHLGLSPRTLDRYRVTGEGPVFHRFGTRVRYARADLEAWAQVRRRRSTADDGLGRAA